MLPAVVARDDDDGHAGHCGAGGIGAVRRLRDQRDVALRLAARGVERLDDEQAGELALRPGIRLERHGRQSP